MNGYEQASCTRVRYLYRSQRARANTTCQQCTNILPVHPVEIYPTADGLHTEHHTGATIFGASSHGELRTLVDAIWATPPPPTAKPRNIWVVIDATVHTSRSA